MIRAILLATTLLIFSGGLPAQPFEPPARLVVFGDSLSDTGNVYETAQAFGQDFPPSPPYFDGRFSDGPVWVEYLALDLGLAFDPDTNYAWGGAESGDDDFSIFAQTTPGLLTQVDDFRGDAAALGPFDDTLFCIWIGGNDYLGAGNPAAVVDTVIGNIDTALGRLADAGATRVALVNLPPLGSVPGAGSDAAALTAAAEAHNAALDAEVAGWESSHGLAIRIVRVDDLFTEIFADPESFGFTNLVDPCLDEDLLVACPNPEASVFWDEIHPTTAAHERVAGRAYEDLFTSPEPRVPTSWILYGD